MTPLQMAMVAATIGNNGIEMQPYVVSRIVSPGGKTIVKTKPHGLADARSRWTPPPRSRT